MMVLLAVPYVLGEEIVTMLMPARPGWEDFPGVESECLRPPALGQFAAYPVDWPPGVGVGWLFWSALEARQWLGKPLEHLLCAVGCCLLQSLRCPQLCAQ